MRNIYYVLHWRAKKGLGAVHQLRNAILEKFRLPPSIIALIPLALCSGIRLPSPPPPPTELRNLSTAL